MKAFDEESEGWSKDDVEKFTQPGVWGFFLHENQKKKVRADFNSHCFVEESIMTCYRGCGYGDFRRRPILGLEHFYDLWLTFD